MELRLRIRPKLRQIALPVALIALAAPATAGAAPVKAHASKAKVKLPVITSISPKRVAITQTLSIRGRNFLRGRNKNTVVFKRKGAKAIFVKAGVGTTKLLQVVVPKKLESILVTRNGAPVETRFALRVLTTKFGKRFTGSSLSPIVTTEPPPPTTPPASAADGDCDGDGVLNGVDTDDDNDLLPDTEEKRLNTDPCKADSDGDGVTDGYEYQSAVDLNDDEYRTPQNIVPAPYAKPYPNPLFADANNDYDGDGLSLSEEFDLWKAYRNPAKGLTDLVYSDGNQYSAYTRDGAGHRPGPLVPGLADPEFKYQQFSAWASANGYDPVERSGSFFSLRDTNHDGTVTTSPAGVFQYAETRPFDFDFDAKLSDDERDEDGDGLTNYDESHGRMQPGYWIGCYKKEKPYPIAYAGTSLVNPDSDGDGILDGADDQDHDDIPNLMELSRNAASGRPMGGNCNDASAPVNPNPPEGRVNPFNPCLPNIMSRTCQRHPTFGDPFAPFDPDAPDYLVLN